MPDKATNGQRFIPVANTECVEAVAVRSRYGEHGPVSLIMHNRSVGDLRATFAMSCIEKWGMIMGMPDGEDSVGRQKCSLMPSDQIVARACETAERAFAAFKERGWIMSVPSYQELLDQTKAQETAND